VTCRSSSRLSLAELLRLAPGYEALVTWSEGRLQPLCAAYSRACIDRIERRLRAGDPSLADFLSDVNARYLRPEEWRASTLPAAPSST